MAERAGAYDLVARAAVNESHLLEGAGEHELAVAAARRGTAGQGAQYLARMSRTVLAINQVEPLLALGRWGEAVAVAEEAREFQLASLRLHGATLEIMRGRIALARGEVRAATDALAAARELLRGAPGADQYQLPFATLEILLHLATAGAAAGIITSARVVDDHDLSGGSPRYAWPLVVAGATACLAAAGQVRVTRDERLGDDVAALACRLRTIAEKLETSGRAQEANRLTFAAADAHVAQLLAAGTASPSGVDNGPWVADGAGARLEAAGLRAAWDQAAAAWDAVSEPYPVAQALLHAGETALACGDRDGAAEALRRAAGLAGSLGAASLSEQIAILARRARIALAGPGDTPSGQGPGAWDGGAGDLGLTGREREVLRLVAAGRSNKEIAAELFISPKTASVHVSNILGKLGAASRGEAAAKAHDLRLFGPG